MGEGVPEDAKMAVKWYTKAAEKGHKDAMYSLAVCYEKGTGVAKDMQKAREWINKLSAKGDGRAKIWLDKH
jgi:TPR repeat protein